MKRHKGSPPGDERVVLEQEVESLQRRIHRLQLEHDTLTKANELIKKTRASICSS